MAPVELECPAGGTCTYVTPKLEITNALTLLEMHERTAHSRDDGASATGRSCKPEKFPRPTVGMDETSERWGTLLRPGNNINKNMTYQEMH